MKYSSKTSIIQGLMKSNTLNKLTAFCKSLIPIKNDTVLAVLLKIFTIVLVLAITIFLFPITISLLIILLIKDSKFKNEFFQNGMIVFVAILGIIFSFVYWTRDVDTNVQEEISSFKNFVQTEEDISDLLNETKSIIKEFNENLTIASNYNIDISKYKDVDVLGVTDDASTDEIEGVYNQINLLNEELETAIKEAQSKTYKVVEVVDGDTIKIIYNGVKTSVRLIGIDTPETVDPRKPVQCFGKEASAKMKSLVDGKEVNIMFDYTQGTKDKYSRLLLYVWVGDTFVNELMIKQGYAHEYTYSTPYKYQTKFKEAQELAESSENGLWGDICACEKKELSRKCTSCKTSTVTYQKWDCSTYSEKITDSKCTSSCSVSTVKTSPSYICNCSKTCPQMSSCEEAQYQLKVCGCSARDADKDGLACDLDCQ